MGRSIGRSRWSARLCIRQAEVILRIWLTGSSIIRRTRSPPGLLKVGDFWCSSAGREYRPLHELLQCCCHAPGAHGTPSGARPTPRGWLRPSLSTATLRLPATLIIGSASSLSNADGMSVAHSRHETWSTSNSRAEGCRWCTAFIHSRCASPGPRARGGGDVGSFHASHTVSAACLASLLRA